MRLSLLSLPTTSHHKMLFFSLRFAFLSPLGQIPVSTSHPGRIHGYGCVQCPANGVINGIVAVLHVGEQPGFPSNPPSLGQGDVLLPCFVPPHPCGSPRCLKGEQGPWQPYGFPKSCSLLYVYIYIYLYLFILIFVIVWFYYDNTLNKQPRAGRRNAELLAEM